jgi:phosphoenolpyruvate carboxykinase (ATP)
LPLRPKVYAEMLGQRLRQHHASCWLINTGWQGGKFGVGRRMDLNYTRAMVRAAVEDRLNDAEFEIEPAFGLSIPKAVPEVPRELLSPRNAWAEKGAYDRTAQELAERFARNFEKFEAPAEVRAAAPAPVSE